MTAATVARNKGTCSNRKSILRSEVEDRLLAGLKEKLMAPAPLAEFIAEFQREMRTERQEAMAARDGLERKLAKVCKEIANMILAIREGMFHPSMNAQMDVLESERAELEARLSDAPALDPSPFTPVSPTSIAAKSRIWHQPWTRTTDGPTRPSCCAA